MKSGDLLYSPCVNVIRILSPKRIILGGGVDTQRVLGSGAPDEVRADTRKRIEDLAPGGGFVFAGVQKFRETFR